ncbi:hypothetical protein BDS110ZK25_02280 [Bradyrhizobium diazoefficiens]|uniref:Uncharacterized protein n=1 Tax=Bradyrhizobium diazoefficiens TaxID=1355477 RepID=A0A809YE61_9BRAD|nr:hypothetical protein F07S3_41040 [Bradyrhizobium diazoefficiens]BCA03274.1 hypothetical protein H12S4_41780 [Bradyrhizobium diazoefficiens]BCA12022.1 hypothetical protein BDHF08_38690 [Bradyrhizobium diazoefficiens]BCA20636.1 hypothetical protein BDHH15_38510 [Bradyrhizobium diazoefficiens]BCE21250.1 hypothetical protein XF1B_39310 [Bradyrhizobium diazoefficiens]
MLEARRVTIGGKPGRKRGSAFGEITEQDFRPLDGKQSRNRGSNPGAGAGDDGNLSLEQHHTLPFDPICRAQLFSKPGRGIVPISVRVKPPSTTISSPVM